jgi:hypothetical protein
MNTVGMKSRSRTSKLGWGILLGLSALLVLNGIALYAFIAAESGEQTVGILVAGMGLFGLALSQSGYSSRSRRIWKMTWILTAVLLALAINITLVGETLVGLFYMILTGIALLGQALAARELEG